MRTALHEALRAIPYSAYFWETPPITRATVDLPFEFAAIESPTLARFRPDSSSFEEHYSASRKVTVFESLGRDAQLIAPCPESGPDAIGYPHLAAFAHFAPTETADALWRQVGQTVLAGLGDAPIWLSTSGLGIPWLHVRVDSRPKYYVHPDYRQIER